MASVYIRRENQILLLYRQGSSIVKNLWIGSAGGHFEENELNDARACVLRELEEELSLFQKDLENLTLRYVTVRYADGELRQNYYFFADLSDSNKIFLPSNEGITQWYPLSDTGDLSMPFTARHMLDHYITQSVNSTTPYTVASQTTQALPLQNYKKNRHCCAGSF